MFIENVILPIVLKQYKLDLEGMHGISHWKRVEELGLFLSDYTNADTIVIRYFAYLHDSQRQDEQEDWDHGKRAADFAEKLYKDRLLHISPKQLEKLQFACCYHNFNKMLNIDDITIQTCWDSDRLDLWRLGVKPDINFLYTEMAKRNSVIEYAARINGLRFYESGRGV